MWKKQLKSNCRVQEEFRTELDILSRLRHKHIIRLLGSCVSKDKRHQTALQKEKRGLLARWRKKNGTLFDQLHPDQGSTALSLVTMSWKIRIDVLLGVSRAIEHLHCHHARFPIIHRDIKSSNILLDASWLPRVCDFGLSVTWDVASDETGLDAPCIGGTFGYMAPEYAGGLCVKPAIDVYSLGVVMLEVLTGRTAFDQEEGYYCLAEFASCSRIIKDGNIEELLDRRPVPEPTSWQLQALKRVALIARCCMEFDMNHRPAMTNIVAELEIAYELFCRDESDSVNESSAGSQSDPVH
ncbi:unnamed protein product [Triticum turgidum subsp. durum]|uniref:Protein kinase domain-containing protein n=1 Tax=Triticum turgidum subsp. durum TaxID=4567 RepID=A0A9R1RG61_TRITD|nr:unnamed protein product [Triticum turgidum subsp. durum]